ncbi:MFS transporter [Rhizorhabdus wittichii]|uniref:MFS transporter n=1 Tax=Rhizorhabdus wittichii TaxID=160791 RepID=A0A975HFT8_9SPHN|nr:MFS transporter [Rhizorhabdus wittichii]ARR52502.1 MFS transporter [Rhizorhabdus wittichii DC-6]QTH23745.1 MFS transporter [Rhizorhabdus wittichii]
MASDLQSAPRSRPASPFGVPVFRSIWIASLVSNFGAMIQSVGAAWMMTSLTSSPKMVALVQASTVLPFMLLALWAGAVADNLDRRKVMLAAQSFMLCVSAALALFAWQGWLTPWLLLSFTFLIGCGTTIGGPAWQASVGDIVSREQLPSAVALNSMGFNTARTAGPAVGGAVVAAAGAAAAFLANTLSYIGLIVVLLRWRRPQAPRLLPREGLFMAMGAGLRYVSMSPNLRMAVSRAMAFGLAANAVSALMPLVARDLVKGGALTYGLLLGAFGVGAVLGGLSSGPARDRLSTEQIVRMATLMLAVGTAITAISPFFLLTIAALMLAGFSWVLALSTFNISVQLASPRWVVARALSVYQMAAFGGMAIGAWVLGMIADSHGVAAGLLVSAAFLASTVLIGLVMPLPQVDDLNLTPLKQWQEPEVAVPLEPRSGPVVVTIEYRIEPHNIVAFLTAMTERRRIRRRDGAHGWTLLRDLNEPELWIERYHVATWHDYIRHNQRRTHADAENSAEVHQLQKEGVPLRVHRMIERQTGSLPSARRHEPVTVDAQMNDPTRSA